MSKIVSRKEWVDARRKHLENEKRLTRMRDELSHERRELPWVEIDKDYRFESEKGTVSLLNLFGNRNQLIVYHFMLGPDWEEGCKSCSCISDSFDSIEPHLSGRDVALVAISRATIAELKCFKARMGWSFEWVSSFESDFNRDFNVHFSLDEIESGKTEYNYGLNPYGAEDAHGISVFIKGDNGKIYHTYSSYARGLDMMFGMYNYLDIVPKGRDEGKLSYTMDWIRHHDKYVK